MKTIATLFLILFSTSAFSGEGAGSGEPTAVTQVTKIDSAYAISIEGTDDLGDYLLIGYGSSDIEIFELDGETLYSAGAIANVEINEDGSYSVTISVD